MSKHCLTWLEAPEAVAASGVSRREIAGAGFGLVRIVIPAGTRAPRHSHSFEQFVQVISGTGTLETDEGREAFGPGSVFHFPEGAGHAAVFETETILVETNLSV